jgi:hypothetical protein
VEVDGVLPGDHLLLPGRSALAFPLRHLRSSSVGSARLGGGAGFRRREKKALTARGQPFIRAAHSLMGRVACLLGLRM